VLEDVLAVNLETETRGLAHCLTAHGQPGDDLRRLVLSGWRAVIDAVERAPGSQARPVGQGIRSRDCSGGGTREQCCCRGTSIV
jgi:hypothetical protein